MDAVNRVNDLRIVIVFLFAVPAQVFLPCIARQPFLLDRPVNCTMAQRFPWVLHPPPLADDLWRPVIVQAVFDEQQCFFIRQPEIPFALPASYDIFCRCVPCVISALFIMIAPQLAANSGWAAT